jgi:hypothetical protein
VLPVREGARAWVARYRVDGAGRWIEESRLDAGFVPLTAVRFRPRESER